MLYRYEASDALGKIIHGEFDAKDKSGIVDYLQKRELIPIKIEEAGGVAAKKEMALGLFDSVSALDRIVIVRNLAATIKAGLSIIEALEIMIEDSSKKTMAKILRQAKINIQNGKPLSSTFSDYKRFFPVIFVGLIKAGEASGQLGKTLTELGQHLNREYNLSKKIKSALAYPIILLIASFGVVLLLFIFVLPRLTKAFSQSGVDLPVVTQAIINVSDFMTSHLILDLLFVVFIIWIFGFYRKTTQGKKVFLNIGMSIPVVKEIIKKVALVRFSRTLGTLISSGIPIIEALQLTAESVGNEQYRLAIIEAEDQIKSGIPLSKAIEPYKKLFPRFLLGLIVVGEKTGTLDGVLKTFAEFYDDEIENDLKDLTTFIEPVLLLVMGLIIGTVAISVLMPIYKLVGSFV